jgi:hypothetical protein
MTVKQMEIFMLHLKINDTKQGNQLTFVWDSFVALLEFLKYFLPPFEMLVFPLLSDYVTCQYTLSLF